MINYYTPFPGTYPWLLCTPLALSCSLTKFNSPPFYSCICITSVLEKCTLVSLQIHDCELREGHESCSHSYHILLFIHSSTLCNKGFHNFFLNTQQLLPILFSAVDPSYFTENGRNQKWMSTSSYLQSPLPVSTCRHMLRFLPVGRKFLPEEICRLHKGKSRLGHGILSTFAYSRTSQQHFFPLYEIISLSIHLKKKKTTFCGLHFSLQLPPISLLLVAIKFL